MTTNQVTISERDIKIAYNVDGKSTYEIANQLGVDVKQVRNALKNLGVIVRRGEVEPWNTPQLTIERLDGTWMNSDGTVTTTTTETTTDITTTYANTMDTPVLTDVFATNNA